ncbi:MAG: PhzF family phenazine biosynthesis protein [Planctomycetaceae bacterium]
MRVPFLMLDVFADTPFAGNQLAVVTRTPEGLDAHMMQVLAKEIGFSETTFVTAIRPDGYDVRIFTPEVELPFAGHPTLGTAFALASEGLTGTEVIQRCTAGEVPVVVDPQARRATMRQLPPVFGRGYPDRAAAAAGAGLAVDDLVDDLPIVPVSTGIAHLMVPVRDEAALRRAVRDDRACARACEDADDAESLYLFTVRGDGDVMARMFDRFATIGEDPATGSAAGPLGAYLAEHRLAGMPGTCLIAQGELAGRPSFLSVDVRADDDGAGWTIHVGGGVHRVGDGAFEVEVED